MAPSCAAAQVPLCCPLVLRRQIALEASMVYQELYEVSGRAVAVGLGATSLPGKVPETVVETHLICLVSSCGLSARNGCLSLLLMKLCNTSWSASDPTAIAIRTAALPHGVASRF